MSDIAKDISRYFRQRQELFPEDFYEKPSIQPIAEKQSRSKLQAEINPQDNSNSQFLITSGNPESKIIFLCTRPLKQDIEDKILLSGEAGKLFDKIIKAIDLCREDVYITPLRFVSETGTISEKTETVIIDKLIDEKKPKVIVSLGDNAGNEILGENYKLEEVHGQIFKYKDVPFVFTYHPELVRHNEQLKRPVWEDFKIIRDIISK